MKSQFVQKFLVMAFLASLLLFSHVACSKYIYDQAAELSQGDSTAASQSLESSVGSKDQANRQPSSVAINYNYTKPVVEGYATGIAKADANYEFEQFAPAGSTIQIHYSISDIDSYQTSYQIFPVGGSEEITDAANGHTLLAQGTDGRPYAYAQYANLEKVTGLHVFNLPLKYAYANGVVQFLKEGQYKLYITACATVKLSSCRKSRAIFFEVK